MKTLMKLFSLATLTCILAACGNNKSDYVGKYQKDNEFDNYTVYVHEDNTWVATGMWRNVIEGRQEGMYLYGHVVNKKLAIDGGNTTYYDRYNGISDLKGEILDPLWYDDGTLNGNYTKDETWTKNRKDYYKRIKKEHDSIRMSYGMIAYFNKRDKHGREAKKGDYVYGEISGNGLSNTGKPTYIARADFRMVPSLERALFDFGVREGDEITIVFDADELATVNQLYTTEILHEIKLKIYYVGSQEEIERDIATMGNSYAGTYEGGDGDVESADIIVNEDGSWTATGEFYYDTPERGLGDFEYSGDINNNGELVIRKGTFSRRNDGKVVTVPAGEVFGNWKRKYIDLDNFICNKVPVGKVLTEAEKISQYIADNNISVAPTSSGLYIIVNKEGNGKTVQNGSTVTVDYIGRFLDGTVFDCSREDVAQNSGIYTEQRQYGPITYKAGDSGLIAGWEEGVMGQPAGTELTLIMPSSLAYGQNGVGEIPPYTPLVLNINILSVE